MSLYDRLGVSPSASTDELHHAYRERARVLHPDRQSDASAPARAAAEAQMRELDAAWAVLSDPAERQEYDRSLAPRSVAPPGPAPVFIREDDDQITYDRDGVAKLARAVPLIALLVVLGAIFVFTAFALNGSDDSVSPASRSEAEVGNCVTVRAGHVSEVVACGVPNDGRVEHIVDRSQPCPPGERRADGRDGSHALCLV